MSIVRERLCLFSSKFGMQPMPNLEERPWEQLAAINIRLLSEPSWLLCEPVTPSSNMRSR
jgi:hypothetical protein